MDAQRSELGVLVGEWDLTLSGAWFLESLETEQRGRASIQWLGDAFMVMRSSMQGEPIWDMAFGRSDAVEQMYALYHDKRGVDRLFTMTFDGRQWALSREDPDSYQRFTADIEPDQISGRWEASEDEGRSWRKDFDLLFIRTAAPFEPEHQ